MPPYIGKPTIQPSNPPPFQSSTLSSPGRQRAIALARLPAARQVAHLQLQAAPVARLLAGGRVGHPFGPARLQLAKKGVPPGVVQHDRPLGVVARREVGGRYAPVVAGG